jgi:hypothetical protein
LPALIGNVEAVAPGSMYARVVNTVGDFVADDHAWQKGTISITKNDHG